LLGFGKSALGAGNDGIQFDHSLFSFDYLYLFLCELI
jgi:hypothetical protein